MRGGAVWSEHDAASIERVLDDEAPVYRSCKRAQTQISLVTSTCRAKRPWRNALCSAWLRDASFVCTALRAVVPVRCRSYQRDRVAASTVTAPCSLS